MHKGYTFLFFPLLCMECLIWKNYSSIITIYLLAKYNKIIDCYETLFIKSRQKVSLSYYNGSIVNKELNCISLKHETHFKKFI